MCITGMNIVDYYSLVGSLYMVSILSSTLIIHIIYFLASQCTTDQASQCITCQAVQEVKESVRVLFFSMNFICSCSYIYRNTHDEITEITKYSSYLLFCIM